VQSDYIYIARAVSYMVSQTLYYIVGILEFAKLTQEIIFHDVKLAV